MKIKELMLLAWQKMTPSQRTYSHLKWLVRQGFDEIAENYSTVVDGQGFYPTEDIQHCDHCDQDYANDCLEEVQISRNRWEMWCENCRDNDAFWCNGSEQWYSCGHYNSIEFNGDLYEESHAPDDYSDDCDEGARGLLGYHSDTRTRNNWRKHDPTRDLFGVELEMRGTSLPNLECLCDIAHQLKFIPETDGSLHKSYSVEIVGYPMPLKDYRRGPWAEFLKVARGRSEGWNAGKGYGIHVSIGRQQLSPMEQSKLVKFFIQNQDFCEVVAGRKDGNWAHYRRQSWLVGRTPFTDRYCAVSLRDPNRIEIRAFRSTIHLESFLKNVQFVAACMEFVRENGALDLDVHTFWRFITHKSFANRYRELITHSRVASYIEQKGISVI